jgi:hypothetical protein
LAPALLARQGASGEPAYTSRYEEAAIKKLVPTGCADVRDTDAQSEPADNSPHRTGFVTVNKVKLHFLDWGGNGQTLLFLHGMGDTAHRYDMPHGLPGTIDIRAPGNRQRNAPNR